MDQALEVAREMRETSMKEWNGPTDRSTVADQATTEIPYILVMALQELRPHMKALENLPAPAPKTSNNLPEQLKSP